MGQMHRCDVELSTDEEQILYEALVISLNIFFNIIRTVHNCSSTHQSAAQRILNTLIVFMPYTCQATKCTPEEVSGPVSEHTRCSLVIIIII